MAPERVRRARWRAMGSDVELVVVGGPDDLLERGRRRLAELEARWSRFRPDSEVSRMNASAGAVVHVSADTVRLVRAAIDAWRESGGAVNPTVLGDVVRAGYDRSFEHVPACTRSVSTALALVACTDIAVGERAVGLPAGTGFDPGGIGKGLAADSVVEELRAAGAAGACVNVGGDLRVSGCSPSGAGWTIAVHEPLGDATLALVGVADGAVATSTTARRRWNVDGAPAHHLIDPATGAPSRTDVVQATVIAAHGWLAEAHAKTVLLRGSTRAFDVLPAGMAAIVVRDDGRILATPSIHDHLGGAQLPDGVVLPAALAVPSVTAVA